MTRVESKGSKWYQKPCKECKWTMGHSDRCSKYFDKLSDIFQAKAKRDNKCSRE